MLTFIWILIMQQVNAQSCVCNETYPDGCLINQNCSLVISHSNSTWNAVDELVIENCNVTICLEKLVGKAILNFSQLTVNNASIIQDDTCYFIMSQQLIFLGNQTIISTSNILFYGNIQLQFIATNMSIGHANVLSNSLNICTDYLQVSNSTIRALMQNKSQCSCLSNQNCSNQMYIKTIFSFVGYITQNYTNLSSQYIEQQWISQFQCSFFSPKTLTYFTSLISVKNHFSLTQHSKIKGFYVGIYAYSLEVDQTSQILTDGMGYSTNEGFGCGYTDKIIGLRQQCGGTGGSHGGMGGFSISPKSNYNQLCLQLQSKQIYDYSFNPVLPGSGGGGVTYGNQFYKFEIQGQGGGVMHLEVLDLQNDGIISSNGTAYIQQPFFGSGSGGSIQIRIIYFSGNGLVTADGGGSQSGNDYDTDQFARQKFYQTYQIYGGFGGGGRIRLFFFNITEMINSSYYQNCNNIMQTNPGGLSIQQKDILNMSNQSLIKFQGSITPTGCPQGTQGNYCQQCGKGYYKMLFGQAPCKPCFNTTVIQDFFVAYSFQYQLTQSPQPQNLLVSNGENTPFCKVVCNDGKQPKEDQCLTGLAEFSQKLGGQNVIFALFVIIILLLINIAIVWVSRDKNKKKARQFYGSYDDSSSFQQMTNSLSELNNKTYLISQDLHFHVRRIYLAGCNTYQNPWQIYQETLVDSDLNQGENKEWQVLFETFNQKALFTIFEKYTLIFFKFYYYPLYIWILQLIQVNKFKTLSKLFVKQEHLYNGLDSDRDKMKLKFSCSKDKTLAFIDRLNLALKIVEQSNTLELPIYLVLSGYGTFSYPFQINIHDALIKRLWQQFSFNTNEESINLFEKFVTEFNYYAVKIDFRQSQSSFIKRFLDLVNYTNQYNYEIFRLHHVIQVDICIHIIAIQPSSQSQVYLLGNANQRELEFLLKQIHVMKNLPEEFTTIKILSFSYEFKILNQDCIKLSIIFNNYNKERIINLESFNNLAYNINEQLQIIVNKDKDDLKNQIQQEKKKMQSKINCFKMDGMKQYKLKGIQVVKRFFTWLFSQITRYRDSRVNQQFLIAGICITLAIQWCFVIAYPVLLFIVNDLESDQIFVAEFITQLVIFPVAQIISLVILSAWLLKSRRNYGKMYLLFNLCALASSLIEFIFGCYDLFNFNSSAEFNLFKLFPFFFIMLSSHLVCLQMNFNELNKTKYFEI